MQRPLSGEEIELGDCIDLRQRRDVAGQQYVEELRKRVQATSGQRCFGCSLLLRGIATSSSKTPSCRPINVR